MRTVEAMTKVVRKLQNQIALGVTTKRQELCLSLIDMDSSITTLQISRFLKCTRESANELTNQLDRKGLFLIHYKVIGKRRRKLYSLTEKGLRAIGEGGES